MSSDTNPRDAPRPAHAPPEDGNDAEFPPAVGAATAAEFPPTAAQFPEVRP